MFVGDLQNFYLCNVSDKHRALIKIILMPMKEEDFKRRKGFLESLFMNYSGQMNDHSDQEKDLIMKNIDVILYWYNALVKEMEE